MFRQTSAHAQTSSEVGQSVLFLSSQSSKSDFYASDMTDQSCRSQLAGSEFNPPSLWRSRFPWQRGIRPQGT